MQDVLKIWVTLLGTVGAMSHTREAENAPLEDVAAGHAPPLLPERAFVVQVRSGLDHEDGDLAGRVEHIVSGEAMHFRSPGELLAFLRRVLLGTRTPAGAPAAGKTRPTKV